MTSRSSRSGPIKAPRNCRVEPAAGPSRLAAVSSPQRPARRPTGNSTSNGARQCLAPEIITSTTSCVCLRAARRSRSSTATWLWFPTASRIRWPASKATVAPGSSPRTSAWRLRTLRQRTFHALTRLYREGARRRRQLQRQHLRLAQRQRPHRHPHPL